MEIYNVEVNNNKLVRFNEETKEQLIKNIDNKQVIFKINEKYYILEKTEYINSRHGCCFLCNPHRECLVSFLLEGTDKNYNTLIMKEKELFEIEFGSNDNGNI